MKTIKKANKNTKAEDFLAEHLAYIEKMCGRKATICNLGWYQSPTIIESKVTDKDGFDWIIHSEAYSNGRYHHERWAQKGFDQ